MNRIIRTSIKNLPPSADSIYQNAQPGVTQSHFSGKVIKVKTYCGVILQCIIVSSRYAEKGVIYEVKPHGNSMINEFNRAGVPTTNENAWNTFVAFDWQIVN